MPIERGSISKEFSLDLIRQTLLGVQASMTYAQLRGYAGLNTRADIAALLCHRWLLLDSRKTIVYDRFLSIMASEGFSSIRFRKIMYFTWFFRDTRLRKFITDIV